MITYNWKIGKLTTLIQSNEQQNVVVKARWICTGEDGAYSYTLVDNCVIPFNANDTFTNYDQLTEAEVLSWVWNVIDKTATENKIAGIIENKKNPPVANLPLPWTTQ